VTTCMNLEGFTLSQISQTRTNMICFILCGIKKKKSNHKNTVERWSSRAEDTENGEMLVQGYKLSHKINMF